ncbi:MAG: hypothetical protein U7126_19695 [Microcoleus sp.]
MPKYTYRKTSGQPLTSGMGMNVAVALVAYKRFHGFSHTLFIGN